VKHANPARYFCFLHLSCFLYRRLVSPNLETVRRSRRHSRFLLLELLLIQETGLCKLGDSHVKQELFMFPAFYLLLAQETGFSKLGDSHAKYANFSSMQEAAPS